MHIDATPRLLAVEEVTDSPAQPWQNMQARGVGRGLAIKISRP
jgi:hypothetical protein